MSRRDGLLGYVVTNRLYCGFIGFDNNDDDIEDQSLLTDIRLLNTMRNNS